MSVVKFRSFGLRPRVKKISLYLGDKTVLRFVGTNRFALPPSESGNPLVPPVDVAPPIARISSRLR